MSQQFIADVVKLKTMGVALVAGAGAMVGMNANLAEAISFGAITGLGTSIGDAALQAIGKEAKLDSFYPDSPYVDPSDFVAAGSMTALLQYTIMGGGQLGPEFYKIVVIAAIAGGTGNKVASYIEKTVGGSKTPIAGSAVM